MLLMISQYFSEDLLFYLSKLLCIFPVKISYTASQIRLSMITIEAQLSYSQLIEAVNQLDSADLENLQAQVNRLKASRRGKSLPKREAELLLKINQLTSPKNDPRYQELLAKQKSEELSKAEQKELSSLIGEYESQDLKRVKYLTKLAKLRGVSLTELMQALEISEPQYG